MPNHGRYHLRYSLARLGAVIALACIGLAALRAANPWWAVGLVYLTFLMLLVAATVSLYRRSTFTGGFALGGLGWLLLLYAFSLPGMRTPDDWPDGYATDGQGNITGSTKGPYAIEENVLHPEQICRKVSSWFQSHMPLGPYRSFRVALYCVATWLIGMIAGLLALFIHTGSAESTD